MRAVVFVAAHELRTRWRGWAVLALLVAVAGGAVLAAAAGARRTASAYPRFLTASKASDVLVAPSGSGLGGYFDALGRLPGAAAVAPVAGLTLRPLSLGARGSTVLAPVDGRFGRFVDVPRVLAGRLPAAGSAGEIAVDQRTAARMSVQVGSVVAMRAFAGPPVGTGIAGTGPARRGLLRERVVGVVVTRGSVLSVNEIDKDPVILASPALFHRLGVRYVIFTGAYVRLRPAVSAEAFARQAQALARRHPATGGGVFAVVEGAQAAAVQHAIRPEAVALALFTLVLAVTGLLIVGQAATRLLATGSLTSPALAALGMTRGQLMAAGLIEVGVAAATGAIVAAGVAVAASPLMPIGAARLAEPDPGISADTTVLAAGAAAIVVLLAARAAWPAWRLASTGTRGSGTPAAPPPRPFTAWLAAVGAPVTMTAGVRIALEPGHRRTAVPVRAALAGTTLSVAAVTAALTFGANLPHLVNTPALYGQRWDAMIDTQLTPAAAEHRLSRLPGIAAWTFGYDTATVRIGGRIIPEIGLTAGKGPLLSPTLLQGRPPRTGSEIVLGTSTLRQIRRRVGQSVAVTVNGHPLRQRIVGRAVFPNIGGGGETPADLGQGAQTTAAVLKPRAQPNSSPGYDFVLVKFTPGPRRAANIARFQRSINKYCLSINVATCVVTDQRPNGVTNDTSIGRTPAALAALLAVIGAAVLGQFIVVSGQRRRRDFAIFKALGMSRRQVSSITAWQASTLTGLALLIGLPLGTAAGRWSWAIFAHGLGIPTVAVTPIWPVLLTVPAVIAIANAVALWPGRATARLNPAEVLRAE